MSNISGLYNNIAGTITNPNLPWGENNNKFYKVEVLTDNLRSEFKQENWIKSKPYSFQVVKSDGSALDGFAEFTLPLNPSNISQSEDFAIAIRPTQGGTIVSHGGNRYKTLSISGTTGLTPFKGSSGVLRSTGENLLQPNTLQNKSGYEVFNELRNYFKAYYQNKKNATTPEGRQSKLLWKNYKDGEFLIIEINSFKMTRDAEKPFLYNYSIDAKVLEHLKYTPIKGNFLDNVDTAINTAMEYLNLANAVFLRSSEVLKQINAEIVGTILEPLNIIRSTIASGKALAMNASMLVSSVLSSISAEQWGKIAEDLKSKEVDSKNNNDPSTQDEALKETPNLENTSIDDLKKGIANKTIDPKEAFGAKMELIDQSLFPNNVNDLIANSSTKLNKNDILKLVDEISDVERVYKSKIGLTNIELDEIFNITTNIEQVRDATLSDYEVLNGFQNAKLGLLTLISTEDIINNINGIETQTNDFLPNVDTKAVKQIILESNTSLERIALNELGDSSRWVELAELNNLKSPFITQDINSTLDNVAKPGDYILIPQPVSSGFGNIPNTSAIPISQDLTQLEKKLGVDLKLNEDFDLALGNNGNIDFIVGKDNITQAIMLKLNYEKGDLIKYPSLGHTLPIGEKVKDVQEIRTQILSTLQQDPRIERITDFLIKLQGNTYNVFFKVFVKNVDIPVPVLINI